MSERLDRRLFLASLASTGALAACSGGVGKLVPAAPAGEGTRATGSSGTMLSVINDSHAYPDEEIFYYVWGQDVATGTFRYLLPDGSTKQWTPAIGNDFGIKLSKKRSVTLPKLSAAEIYVSLGEARPNFLNGQSGQTQPAALNGWTPNAIGNNFGKLFDHIEYTYAGNTLGVNTTNVDMFGLPFRFVITAGGTKHTFGFKPERKMSELYAEFEKRPLFRNLRVAGGKGHHLRVISPFHGIENQRQNLPHQFGAHYLDTYIGDCWSYYTTHTLSVYTDDGKTLLATGRVDGNGVFVFTNPQGQTVTWTDPNGKTWSGFPKPTTYGALSCDDAELPSPSNNGQPPTSMTNTFGSCGKILGASLNRTILKRSTSQPYCDSSHFYETPHSNFYAKILHEFTIRGQIYAFPYDDVCGYSNYVALENATQLELIVAPLV